MLKKILLIILCTLFTILSKSQSFEAKVITGFAASQIGGDDLSGYNQLGGVAGFATDFKLSDKVDFQQEIVYYGRGSRASAEEATAGSSITIIGLHLVDFTGLLNYHIDEKIIACGGLGYGNLIFEPRTDFSRDAKNYRGDLYWTLGGGYYLSDNIIGVGKFQYSILSINKFRGMYSNTINFSLRFILNGQ